MGTIFSSFLNQGFGQIFSVERSGTISHELMGIKNKEKNSNKKYVGFQPGSDVQLGDWLINEANDRFQVIEVETDFFQGAQNQLKAFFQTKQEMKISNNSPTSFHIGNAYGSVIGTQAVVNMNYQAAIPALREQISKSDSCDKEDLDKIIDLLQMVLDGQVPASKGLFSKFSGALERNSWITGSLASTVLTWLTTQVS